jgi:hypothetical protein
MTEAISFSVVQVKVINLQGKNYVFTIRQTFHAIVPHECTAVASKTKKNILIIMQVCSLTMMDPVLTAAG